MGLKKQQPKMLRQSSLRIASMILSPATIIIYYYLLILEQLGYHKIPVNLEMG